MKVLVIGTLYEPDLGPSAPLFALLSENLVKRGHQVPAITMMPHYPSGQVRGLSGQVDMVIHRRRSSCDSRRDSILKTT